MINYQWVWKLYKKNCNSHCVLLVLYSCELDEGLPSLIHALSHSGWVKLKANIFFFCKSKRAKDWGEGKVSSPALHPTGLVYWGQMIQSFVLFLFLFLFLVKRNSFAMDWKLHASEEGFPLPVECILLHLTCTCKCILDMPYWVEASLIAV